VVAVEISGLGQVQSTIVDWDVDLTSRRAPEVSGNTLHVALAIPEDEAERIAQAERMTQGETV